METNNTETQNTQVPESIGIRFLKANGFSNLKEIGKRQLKRIEWFLTESNYETFSSKGFRTILALTSDPHIVTTGKTRSQIVMEYRKHDKALKTIAKSVVINGNAKFNVSAGCLRETDFGRNTVSFRNEFLIVFNNG